MADNLARLVNILEEKKLDGLIVTNPTNIFYLSGFKGLSPTEREAILAVSNNFATLITARLYQTEARLLASSRLRIKIVDERNQILTNIKNLFKTAKRVGLPTETSVKMGFEQKNLTFDEHKEFKRRLNPPAPNYSSSEARSNLKNYNSSKGKFSLRSNNKIDLVPTKDIIENLRAKKTEEEISKIEKAQVISQRAFDQIIRTLKVGQTEEEIGEKLAQIIKSLGGQGLAFESIIASGPNSGRPHYFTGQRPIANGELLLMDFGAKYQDYCADLSRTIFIGKTDDSQKNIYNHILNAQKAAIDKISHGSKSHEIHNIASNIFKDQKLHKYFLHGLGHGIGLEVHESPHLRPLAKTRDPKEPIETLTENMVFSVEPGLYFPWGGVRIEDLVVIKNGKANIVGKFHAEIIEI